MHVQHFFDPRSWTLSYAVHAEGAREALVIDPVADFDPRSGRLWQESNEAMARYLRERDLGVPWVLETHAHADHLSGAPFFQEHFGAQVAIGARITDVQRIFRDVFDLGQDFPVDGSQFDRLLQDGEHLEVAGLEIEVLHTPGHTPGCVSYRIDDALFVGDTLFAPDHGTARCDFPGGSAATLWDSIQRLYAFPDETRAFLCHDYQPGGRELVWVNPLGEHKRGNLQLSASTSRADFVAFREGRDAGLDVPTLILPSVQVNVQAGRLPEPAANGISYLKLPVNGLGG